MLKDNIDSFKQEAKLIDEAKCYLINYHNLDDFYYDGGYAYSVGTGYGLVYNDLHIILDIEDDMIVDYHYY